MKERGIKRVIPAQKVNMGGHLLDQPLPTGGVEYIDPFLLIHHWKSELPANSNPKTIGVGPHPHRGFSPVTYIYKGDVHHRDSLGNSQVVAAGGTQWMFAGKGITHSERQSAALAKQGGELEFIQFWVNAPSANKMEKASYLPLSADDTPTVSKGKSSVQVVVGEYEGTKGATDYFMPLLLLRVTIEAGETLDFDIPAAHNTLFYQLDGELSINGQKTVEKDMTWFENDGTKISVTAASTTRFMVMAGEPIGEKVTSYGPFVMNNSTEIMEALRDSQMGKMGILIEDF